LGYDVASSSWIGHSMYRFVATKIIALSLVGTLSIMTPSHAWADQHFQMMDRLDPSELEENTTIFINDQPVANFVLNQEKSSAIFQVNIPDASTYTYRICGKIIGQNSEGESVIHNVDTSGNLNELESRIFEARTLDYKAFYLRDVTPDGESVIIRPGQARGCVALTS
jgi:hypothetical protein